MYYDEPQYTKKGLLDTFKPVTAKSKNYKNWKAILDWNTCIECRSRHGQVYRMNEVVEPEPPLHVKCRCDIVPMKSIEAGNATKNENDGADYWLKYFGELPGCYITESEANDFGWKRGKLLGKYIEAKMLTMGRYYNTNAHLPDTPGRIWYEADINYYEGRRNGHRILWSNDGLMFVTYDHYLTFYEII